jgi:hypothetical protein
MQILPIRQILVSSDIRIISIVTLGVFLVSLSVWDDKSKSKQEDDDNLLISLVNAEAWRTYFGNSRDHTNDDTGRIDRRFCKHVSLAI